MNIFSPLGPMKKFYKIFDHYMINGMYKYGIRCLRFAIGIVFIWFGILKLIGMSPVEDMIKNSYYFFPYPAFIIFLGVLEIIIGLALFFKIFLRTTLALLWIQIAGTFASAIFSPSIFFNGNPFFLTLEGEFLLKNLVILAASIVIGGYRIPNKI